MFMPDHFIRNLAPQHMPDPQQRAIDEQVGRVIAAISRPTRRLVRRVGSLSSRTATPMSLGRIFENHSAAVQADRQPTPVGDLSHLRSYCETSATASTCSSAVARSL